MLECGIRPAQGMSKVPVSLFVGVVVEDPRHLLAQSAEFGLFLLLLLGPP